MEKSQATNFVEVKDDSVSSESLSFKSTLEVISPVSPGSACPLADEITVVDETREIAKKDVDAEKFGPDVVNPPCPPKTKAAMIFQEERLSLESAVMPDARRKLKKISAKCSGVALDKIEEEAAVDVTRKSEDNGAERSGMEVPETTTWMSRAGIAWRRIRHFSLRTSMARSHLQREDDMREPARLGRPRPYFLATYEGDNVSGNARCSSFFLRIMRTLPFGRDRSMDTGIIPAVFSDNAAEISVANPKVLLVTKREDGDVLKFLEESLKKCNFDYEVVKKASDAFDATTKNLLHAIFVDIESFSKGGIFFAHRMKLIRGYCYTFFVAIVDPNMPLEKRRAFVDLGFNRVVNNSATVEEWEFILYGLSKCEFYCLKLLQEREVFASAADRVRDMIIITDNKHVIRHINRAGAQLLGFEMKEILNRDIRMIHMTDKLDEITDRLKWRIEWQGAIPWKCKSGFIYSVHSRALPITVQSGVISHVVYTQDNVLTRVLFYENDDGEEGFVKERDINDERWEKRKESIARLYNLPMDSSLTKCLRILNIIHSNSKGMVAWMVSEAMRLLTTQNLYIPMIRDDAFSRPALSDSIAAFLVEPTPGSTMRRSSTVEIDTDVETDVVFDLSQATNLSQDVLNDLLSDFLEWNFDIFKLEQQSNHNTLSIVGFKIMTHYNVHKTLGISEHTLFRWLKVVESHYHSDNAYHNSTHAADVVQAAGVFLKSEKLFLFFDDLDVAMILIATAVHDIDHPGKSNSFLINSKHEWAIRYNDMNILESHHCSFIFNIMHQDQSVNILKNCDLDVQKVIRRSVIDMILATDLTKHFENLAAFVGLMPKLESFISGENENAAINPQTIFRDYRPELLTGIGNLGENNFNLQDSVVFIKRILIKCADVSNPTRRLPIAKIWAARVVEELKIQTDLELAMNLPISIPGFDRSNTNIPKSQECFFQFIVRDLFQNFNDFLQLDEITSEMAETFEYWRNLNLRGETGMGE